jgi:UDP-N-acetylglucosamine 2-epimerase
VKVVTVVGTRPEVIRLSRVIPRLDESVNHLLVHTGQNSDHGLNGVFFEEMGIRPPDYTFGVNTNSLGSMLADTMLMTENLLQREKPDAFLVLGDTNSGLSSLIAKRMNIPVYHMEAGNRCFD